MGAIETLGNHILVDGFHVVVDTEQSYGSYVVDTQGNTWLDCYSQFASQALGWNYPALKSRQRDFAKYTLHKVANSDMYSEVYANFVEEFSRITPDFKHYFFIDGGALAVENALKAAFDWKLRMLDEPLCHANRLDVIHLKNAFHGRTGYTMSLTNTDPMKTAGFPQFKWTRVVSPFLYFTGWSDTGEWNGIVPTEVEEESLKQMEAALVHQRGRVAAIIMEPIQGEGGDNHFRAEFFQKVRALADEYDAMLIFDEVQTGLGTTGKMWAYEHFGVKPDMICFGKKTQVCGFCANERIDEVDDNVFQVSGRINSTWGGNTMDMARSTAIMQIIQEDHLVENAAEVGKYFLDGMRELGLKNARGRGMFLAFDCKDTEDRNETMDKLSKHMLALKSGTKSIRFRPHLTMNKVTADQALEFIKMAL